MRASIFFTIKKNKNKKQNQNAPKQESVKLSEKVYI